MGPARQRMLAEVGSPPALSDSPHCGCALDRAMFRHHTSISRRSQCDITVYMSAGCSPFVVVVGWITGHDFTLDFDPFATLALTVSVLHANFVTSDARSHWLMVSCNLAGLLGSPCTSACRSHACGSQLLYRQQLALSVCRQAVAMCPVALTLRCLGVDSVGLAKGR